MNNWYSYKTPHVRLLTEVINIGHQVDSSAVRGAAYSESFPKQETNIERFSAPVVSMPSQSA
jgi:hypothetical protein